MTRRRFRLGVDAKPSRVVALRDVKANGGIHPSARPRTGVNVDEAANHFQSLSHANEAEAFGRHDLSVKPDAIVDDAQGRRESIPSSVANIND